MELLAKAPVLGCAGKRQPGAPVAVGSVVGALGRWIRGAVPPPPPPRVCGTPGGPPVTAPRVRLRDGRHLAYAESGARKEDARFKVVISHGFTGSRLDTIRAAPVSTPAEASLAVPRCDFICRRLLVAGIESLGLFWIFSSFPPKFVFSCSSVVVRWGRLLAALRGYAILRLCHTAMDRLLPYRPHSIGRMQFAHTCISCC